MHCILLQCVCVPCTQLEKLTFGAVWSRGSGEVREARRGASASSETAVTLISASIQWWFILIVGSCRQYGWATRPATASAPDYPTVVCESDQFGWEQQQSTPVTFSVA
jgi:hypothetical protein